MVLWLGLCAFTAKGPGSWLGNWDPTNLKVWSKTLKNNNNNNFFKMNVERLTVWLGQLYRCGGFPGGTSGKEPACQCRRLRHKFNPWVGKIPWRRACNWLPYSCLENPVIGKSGRLRSTGSPRVGYDWSDVARTHCKAGCFGQSLVEMPFVVEQGLGGFGQEVISPR